MNNWWWSVITCHLPQRSSKYVRPPIQPIWSDRIPNHSGPHHVERLDMLRGGKSPRLLILTISLLCLFFCHISCLLQSRFVKLNPRLFSRLVDPGPHFLWHPFFNEFLQKLCGPRISFCRSTDAGSGLKTKSVNFKTRCRDDAARQGFRQWQYHRIYTNRGFHKWGYLKIDGL